ncbi:MAG: ankyrin repeat domain-containing protein [Kiritimatiellae bacterium]|nr:ankyrin repeat domain-containing protein [Kiritimatiellia bacterium]
MDARRLLILAALLALGAEAHGKLRPTGIHEAVLKGDLAAVKSMLAGADSLLDARDFFGHTPLSMAAAYGRWDVFRHLLEAGADATIVTKTRCTPLHCVCYHDRPDMVELLFQHGGAAGMTVGDIYGEYTPMLRAVQRGCGKVVALLFEKGARPDEATSEGWNALHLAAKYGHRHLYDLLLERGVSPDALDGEGRAPMDHDHGRPEPVPFDGDLAEYAGWYTWQGDPEGHGVDVFLAGGRLFLDDNCLNELYPVSQDAFHCDRDPWRIEFLRDEAGAVDRVTLRFLRRDITLDKVE